MNTLLNQQRQQMSALLANLAFPVKGIVNTVDPDSMTCVVSVQPENQDDPSLSLSPSLPISCIAVGKGFGFIAVPNVGDQVFISFEAGCYQVGVVQGAIFDASDAVPPKGMKPGEWWLVHKTGSYIKFTNDEKLSINGEVQVDITTPTINITCTSVANVTAPIVNINSPEVNLGDLSEEEPTLQPLINGFGRIIYNEHIHFLDPENPGRTLQPAPQMDEATETVNVKAT
jgi:hypothetical protein